ncbi:MAG: hypothetical protein GX228_04340 [Firmicutes bacterium]|nr:hypothetical protein [Bacillota bacterium]
MRKEKAAGLKLGCTVRYVNRMIKGYHQEGKVFFEHGNKGRNQQMPLAKQQ